MSNRNNRKRPRLPPGYRWFGLTYGILQVVKKGSSVLQIAPPHRVYLRSKTSGAPVWELVADCSTREQAMSMAAALVALGEAHE